MILQKLKESTAAFHTLAEELNFSNDLSSGSIQKEDYLLLLKRLHALFIQVSVLQKAHAPGNTIPALFFENKAGLVYEDISVLEKNFITDLSPFRQMAYLEYLGFCYVALGSMLGGQFIYRNIVNMKVDNTTLPLAFYANCKDSVVLHWKTFTNYLDSMHEDSHEQIVNGAATAYLYFIYLCAAIKN